MITHCGLLWHCYVSRKSVGMYKALRAKPELSFRGCPQFQSGEDVCAQHGRDLGGGSPPAS